MTSKRSWMMWGSFARKLKVNCRVIVSINNQVRTQLRLQKIILLWEMKFRTSGVLNSRMPFNRITSVYFYVENILSTVIGFSTETEPTGYICCGCSLLTHVRLFATPWIAACHTSLSFTISWSLFKIMSTKSIMPCNHFILCCPLLLLPSIFSNIRVFSNESAICIMWPQYWSFNSNEESFRTDWFDLLAVQRTLKSLRQLL